MVLLVKDLEIPETNIKIASYSTLHKIYKITPNESHYTDYLAQTKYAKFINQLHTLMLPIKKVVIPVNETTCGLSLTIKNDERADLIPILADALEENGFPSEHWWLKWARKHYFYFNGIWLIDYLSASAATVWQGSVR